MVTCHAGTASCYTHFLHIHNKRERERKRGRKKDRLLISATIRRATDVCKVTRFWFAALLAYLSFSERVAL